MDNESPTENVSPSSIKVGWNNLNRKPLRIRRFESIQRDETENQS